MDSCQTRWPGNTVTDRLLCQYDQLLTPCAAVCNASWGGARAAGRACDHCLAGGVDLCGGQRREVRVQRLEHRRASLRPVHAVHVDDAGRPGQRGRRAHRRGDAGDGVNDGLPGSLRPGCGAERGERRAGLLSAGLPLHGGTGADGECCVHQWRRTRCTSRALSGSRAQAGPTPTVVSAAG
jgi:hypothetical protein